MEMRARKFRLFFISMVGLIILSIHPVYAYDGLFLTGIVKTVDHDRRIVVVDVKSQSCHGLRKFTVDDPAALEDFVGQKIEFSIDGSKCISDQVYKMFPGGRE